MKYKIEKHRNKNVHKYKKNDLDIAITFAKTLYKETGEIIKGIILFGSAAKNINKETENNDIDLLILIDDISIKINKEIIETYKIIAGKIISKQSQRIHLTTLKLSTFWEYIRDGDPVGINILRDGVALIDTGFFDPLHALLIRGKITPSYESIWTYYNRSDETLNNSRMHLLTATSDLYWAVIDSAHAALMKHGEIPQSPEHLPLAIKQTLVKQKLCTQKYADIVEHFYKLYKEITHRQIEDISGIDFEKYYSKAKIFVKKMKEIINTL